MVIAGLKKTTETWDMAIPGIKVGTSQDYLGHPGTQRDNRDMGHGYDQASCLGYPGANGVKPGRQKDN